MKTITLPSVILTKDRQGNIIHSAPLDPKNMKDVDEIMHNPLNERMTPGATLSKKDNKQDIGSEKYLTEQEDYKADSIINSPFNDPSNATNRHSIGYSHSYKNQALFSPEMDPNVIYDYSKYNINNEFNQWLRHPFSDCNQNQCRFPTPSYYGAIFVNYTKGIQYLFTSDDGVQYLSKYADKGDNYYLIPPMNAWLVDKNLNYFSRILPPEDIKSAKIPIKYDNSWKKNIMEEKYDMVLTPSIDLLDGIRVSKVRPTEAIAYLQPPYISKPTPDSTYQPLGPLEGMTNRESFATISMNIFWFIIFIVIVVACIQYFEVDVLSNLNKMKDKIFGFFKKGEEEV